MVLDDKTLLSIVRVIDYNISIIRERLQLAIVHCPANE